MAITKLEAALVQLNRAITLFFEGDYVCSVTLAGAAEEILGTLAERAGNPRAVDFIADFHGRGGEAEELGGDKSAIVKALNYARNTAKHAHVEGEAVDIDMHHALMMLMRAVPMAEQLGVFSEPMLNLRLWSEAHP